MVDGATCETEELYEQNDESLEAFNFPVLLLAPSLFDTAWEFMIKDFMIRVQQSELRYHWHRIAWASS